EVRAEDDDLVRTLAPGNLADDVRRLAVRTPAAVEREADAHGPAPREEVREHVGVGDRERGRGDLRGAVPVVEVAGVGKAVVVGADRTDEHADGADRGRARRPLGAVYDGLAVAGAVLRTLGPDVVEDDAAADRVPLRLELLPGSHAH